MSLPPRLGRLRLVERVGAGGFATVYRYHDEELESDVAVKALAENWAQRADVRERFAAEARILRRADADHVVRVHDQGETAEGIPYFVMTYADRGTVADLLEAGPVPLAVALDLVRQAGLGLEVLHEHGIVHRDIKPQNLLLRSRPDGITEVLVADLGVAKALAHGSGLTQVVGTPAYIAPEQALGRGLDVRADVHALGAVAYQLVTGRLPRLEGFAGLVDGETVPAPSTVADVPRRLDAPLLRAVAAEPDERWPDVRSFVTALLDPAGSTPTPRSRQQWPGRVVLLAALVAVVAFVAAYAVTALLRG